MQLYQKKDNGFLFDLGEIVVHKTINSFHVF